jgi:hypothetical protein
MISGWDRKNSRIIRSEGGPGIYLLLRHSGLRIGNSVGIETRQARWRGGLFVHC